MERMVDACSPGLLTPCPVLLLLYDMYHTVMKAHSSLKALLKELLLQEVSSGLPHPPTVLPTGHPLGGFPLPA